MSLSHFSKMYDWNKEFESYSIYTKNSHSNAFKSIKSYIEADEPLMLSELVNHNVNASIYAVMLAMSMIPSLKCIEYLVSIGTPLNVSFNTNPFGKVTIYEYINKAYEMPTKTNIRCKQLVKDAIARGLVKLNNLKV